MLANALLGIVKKYNLMVLPDTVSQVTSQVIISCFLKENVKIKFVSG